MNDVGTETIAAIATAPGDGAIAVIRVSGPESLSIADRIFSGKGPLPSQRAGNTFTHGVIKGVEGIADEVILLIYRAPHSYTREDSIEIQGHGGSIAARRILQVIIDAGAKLAAPGEFTKRAFLSGRIDLIQAEAVQDLIRARTDRAAHIALEQLQGRLSIGFLHLYDDTLAVAADLEATLDFSEDELPEMVTTSIIARLKDIEARAKVMLASWNEGHLLREGALVVIAGQPNVGKSTLMNALLGRDRAIVTPIAGTTRDTIEEHMVIDGYPVRLVDTAGLRESTCMIESEGIRRAVHLLDQSALVIYMIDGTLPRSSYDSEQLHAIRSKPHIVAINKSDTKNATNHSHATDQSVFFISALTQDGLAELKLQIVKMLGVHQGTQHQTAISERHRRLIVSAHKDITEATLLLKHQTPEIALAASRLRLALETLGEATGRTYHEELLNSIFSRFCIGK